MNIKNYSDQIAEIVPQQIEKVEVGKVEKPVNHGYPYSYGDNGPADLDYFRIIRLCLILYYLGFNSPANAIEIDEIKSDIHRIVAVIRYLLNLTLIMLRESYNG